MAQKDKKTSVKASEQSTSELSRKFKQNPALFIGTVIVLVLIVISFVLVPAIVPESSRGAGDLNFGYYDKAPINWVPGNMFSQYQQQAAQYYQSQGIDLNNFNVNAQIWRQAFEAAVVHAAVLQVAKRSNYTVPKRTVDRQVAGLPQFQENGRFSSALFNQMSETNRLALWEQVREELAKLMFYNDYYSLLIPSAEAGFIANMSSVMRNFEMVSFSVDAYPDSEYLAYAHDNIDLFSAIHLSKFSINSSEREARRILASIKDGSTTFEDAARSQSQDSYADRGGDIGSRYVYELDSEIPDSAVRASVLSLGRGELSDVVRIDNSWTFFRVEEELAPADLEDDFVIDRVRSYVRNFDRGRMEDWAIAQANAFIADVEDSSFETATRWQNLEKSSFGPLPINYGGVDLFTSLESFTVSGISPQDVQNLSRNDYFWNVAFSTPLHTPSEPLVQGSNVLVFYPIEQIESDEYEIENLASMYSSYWQRYISEQSIQYYFINNDRMDDRFWDTYFRIFM
ncbi:MAG: SurA N-terminal domain-containing protein [Treponema sp.]|jgi:hypothetical protein|nr:SurA N-terminal domain-containing protein [Treponema sp.]